MPFGCPFIIHALGNAAFPGVDGERVHAAFQFAGQGMVDLPVALRPGHTLERFRHYMDSVTRLPARVFANRDCAARTARRLVSVQFCTAHKKLPRLAACPKAASLHNFYAFLIFLWAGAENSCLSLFEKEETTKFVAERRGFGSWPHTTVATLKRNGP